MLLLRVPTEPLTRPPTAPHAPPLCSVWPCHTHGVSSLSSITVKRRIDETKVKKKKKKKQPAHNLPPKDWRDKIINNGKVRILKSTPSHSRQHGLEGASLSRPSSTCF